MNEFYNRRLAALLRATADRIEGLASNQVVHTATVTLDGQSETGVRATIEWQQDCGAYLEDGEPMVASR